MHGLNSTKAKRKDQDEDKQPRRRDVSTKDNIQPARKMSDPQQDCPVTQQAAQLYEPRLASLKRDLAEFPSRQLLPFGLLASYEERGVLPGYKAPRNEQVPCASYIRGKRTTYSV